jgi:hypothetical protein
VVTIHIRENAEPEGLESFLVKLVGPRNATLAEQHGSVWIVDNDRVGVKRLLVRDVTVDEMAHTVFVPVLLGGPPGRASNQTVTVRYRTVNGTPSESARVWTFNHQPQARSTWASQRVRLKETSDVCSRAAENRRASHSET